MQMPTGALMADSLQKLPLAAARLRRNDFDETLMSCLLATKADRPRIARLLRNAGRIKLLIFLLRQRLRTLRKSGRGRR